MKVTRSSLVLAVVALALGWRLVASLACAASQLAGADRTGRTLGQRLAAIDEPLAARRHRSLGFSEPIFDAVVERVPQDGLLLIACAPTSRNQKLLIVSLDLLWPRRIFFIDTFAAEEAKLTDRQRERLYALTIADEKLADPSRWERIDGSARYTLWRAAGPRR